MSTSANTARLVSLALQRETFRETNDCGVRALSLAFDVPYAEMHAFLRKHGRRDRKGTPWEAIDAAVKHYSGGRITGSYFGAVYDRPHIVGHWSALWFREQITVASFERLMPKGTYLVNTSGHVLCVRDYKALDFTSGRRHRVKRYLRIDTAMAQQEAA
jgi:hypothetical protein